MSAEAHDASRETGRPTSSSEGPRVSVHVLGYNSRPFLGACLQSVLDQDYHSLEVIFSDNSTSDGSADFVRSTFPNVRVLANPVNLGYAGGHNQGIRTSSGELVMVLNPDVFLPPTFISTLVDAVAARPEVGTVTGRLLRCTFDDSTGR